MPPRCDDYVERRDVAPTLRVLDRVVGRRSSFTSRTSSLYPKALAYRRSVAIDGECFAAADSRRAIADCVVPTRAATSACERPDSALALSTSSRRANSSARSSYAFFTFGRAKARALNCFRVLVRFHFLHSRLRGVDSLDSLTVDCSVDSTAASCSSLRRSTICPSI